MDDIFVLEREILYEPHLSLDLFVWNLCLISLFHVNVVDAALKEVAQPLTDRVGGVRAKVRHHPFAVAVFVEDPSIAYG